MCADSVTNHLIFRHTEKWNKHSTPKNNFFSFISIESIWARKLITRLPLLSCIKNIIKLDIFHKQSFRSSSEHTHWKHCNQQIRKVGSAEMQLLLRKSPGVSTTCQQGQPCGARKALWCDGHCEVLKSTSHRHTPWKQSICGAGKGITVSEDFQWVQDEILELRVYKTSVCKIVSLKVMTSTAFKLGSKKFIYSSIK